MIEQLFGSRTRIKLLKLFLAQPHEKFFIRELTRKIGERINSVRREIANLERFGVVLHEQIEEDRPRPPLRRKGKKKTRARATGSVDKRKYYRVNPDFVLFDELKSLVFKSQLLVGKSLAEAINALGKVKLLLLTGFFVGDESAATDLLVVGSVRKQRLERMLRQLERSFGHQVKYTLMSPQEFRMRKAMTDKFLYKILEGKSMVLVDQTE